MARAGLADGGRGWVAVAQSELEDAGQVGLYYPQAADQGCQKLG